MRACIFGNAGSGKSTLARNIGQRLNCPVIHLDSLYWSKGWIIREDEAVLKELSVIKNYQDFAIDGNWKSSFEYRMQYADTLIFIDVPTIKSLYRVITRYFKHRGNSRIDMAEGCEEKIDLEFIKYIASFRKKKRKNLINKLMRYKDSKDVIILKSNQEINDFLKSIEVGDESVYR